MQNFRWREKTRSGTFYLAFLLNEHVAETRGPQKFSGAFDRGQTSLLRTIICDWICQPRFTFLLLIYINSCFLFINFDCFSLIGDLRNENSVVNWMLLAPLRLPPHWSAVVERLSLGFHGKKTSKTNLRSLPFFFVQVNKVRTFY